WYPKQHNPLNEKGFFTAKKMAILKIVALAIILAISGVIYYANTQSHFPQFLEKNTLFGYIKPRLSITAFYNDVRFPAWEVGFKAFLENPILGWGPENYSVGFNKHYNASVGSEWWDRAHNIF